MTMPVKSRSRIQRLTAHGGAALITAMALAAGAQAGVTGAQASVTGGQPAANPFSPAYQHAYRYGVLPTVSQQQKMNQWAASHPLPVSNQDTGNLIYHGGIDGIGVTTGHQKVYLVFYGSQWGTQGTDSHGDLTLSGDPSGIAPYLQALLKGLGTGGELWSGVLTQYCDGVAVGAQTCPASNTQHVAYPTGGALAGVWADESTPSPQQATGHQLAQEAVNAAGHFGNTAAASNRDAQYVIVSPTGTDPDGYLTGGFCAWHDFNGDPGLAGGGAVPSPYGDIAFTNMPYVPDVGAGCGQNWVNPGSAGTLDGVSIVEGHEYAETVTDQNPGGGWNDFVGSENGDKCAWIPPGTPGGLFDLNTAHSTFAMQTTWSNEANSGHGACEASGDPDTVTVTNPGPQASFRGFPATLQITAADRYGYPLTYRAAGLPPGLFINPSTGLVSGTPRFGADPPITYTVTVTVTDSLGAQGSATFAWSVEWIRFCKPTTCS